ncbi:MAG TPA: acyl-CoA dehydrogenase family protein [Chloroflexota bacterium]
MNFDFTSEQVMLRDLTREFLNRESGPRAVRSLLDEPRGFSDATWQRLAEMGLPGLAIDAAYGGQGLGVVDLALVLEEMGRVAYPGPFFASAVLAAGAVAASGDERQMARFLPDLAHGRTRGTLAWLEDGLAWSADAIGLTAERHVDGYRLRGEKRFVPFAHAADVILVAARTGAGPDGTTVFAVPADVAGLRQAANVEMDRTSRTSTLTFEDVVVSADDVIGEVDRGWAVLGPVLQRAALGAAAEMLGASRRCLELSVEYAGVRQQFGQPIGTFQAIKHACADMLLEVENAHAATYYAAWALDAGAPDAALAVSAAKAYVGDAARKVCGSAIQVHGGIGFTWEYDLHLYFKRAKHNEPLYGDADFHRERAVELMLERAAAERQTPELALAAR